MSTQRLLLPASCGAIFSGSTVLVQFAVTGVDWRIWLALSSLALLYSMTIVGLQVVNLKASDSQDRKRQFRSLTFRTSCSALAASCGAIFLSLHRMDSNRMNFSALQADVEKLREEANSQLISIYNQTCKTASDREEFQRIMSADGQNSVDTIMRLLAYEDAKGYPDTAWVEDLLIALSKVTGLPPSGYGSPPDIDFQRLRRDVDDWAKSRSED